MSVKIYVEGGGDRNKALQTACRRGFAEFLDKAGLRGRMPRVVACGDRHSAQERFRLSLEKSELRDLSMLLIDSEGPLSEKAGGGYVETRAEDRWLRPKGALEDQIHFMVQTMEAWFYADPDALQEFFGHGFRLSALSQRTEVESIPKPDLFDGLKRATQNSKRGVYSKSDHSFQILSRINPATLQTRAAPLARRFLDFLNQVCH